MVLPLDRGYPGVGRGPNGAKWEPRAWKRPSLMVLGGLVALASLTWFVTITFYDSYAIVSESMSPTLQPGDQIMVRQGHDAIHGEIVVYFDEALGGPAISRVVAVGGDRIGALNGVVTINGLTVSESYLPDSTVTENLDARTVPEQYVFLLGDNRADAIDSRVNGAIRRDKLIAKFAFRSWPLSRFGPA